MKHFIHCGKLNNQNTIGSSMNLIMITPEIDHANETELIHGFFTNGLLKLHLRKPHFTFTDYRSFLFQIDKKFHHQISIHDDFSLLKSFPDLGIHLTGKLREEGNYHEKISMINPSTSSTSFHSWKEIEDNSISNFSNSGTCFLMCSKLNGTNEPVFASCFIPMVPPV